MAADKELISGINMMIQGKEEGFNILYSKTYNYVYGRAKMIMKDEQDALDLTQETFIQAYKHIHTLEDANNIYAWLGGIVYRHGMKIFRKKRDVLVNEDAEGIFEDIVSEDKEYSPEENAQLKATTNVIMGMIDELPELQKAAILAFYYDNMKIDDIAEVFDCSSNTIKSRLNYAKKFLKEKVEAHEKAYAYKLHSLSPAVIILALKALLSGEGYTMSGAAAQNVYNLACASCGFVPTAIAVGEAGAGAIISTTASTTAAATTTTTAAATTVSATSTAAASTVATATAKVGMALGTKLIIGVATVATVGTVSVGAVTVANNGGFEGLFAVEDTVSDDEDENDADVLVTETETEVETETENETENETIISYGTLVNEMTTSEYLYETDDDINTRTMLMGDVIVKYAGEHGRFDFKDLSDSGKYGLNYIIMNNVYMYDSKYQIPTTTFEDGTTGYSVEAVEKYLECFYEGGSLVEHPYKYYEIQDDKVVFKAADGEEQDHADTTTLYKKGDYVVLETKVYKYDMETDTQEYQYTAKILFKITDEGAFGLQVLHVQTEK